GVLCAVASALSTGLCSLDDCDLFVVCSGVLCALASAQSSGFCSLDVAGSVLSPDFCSVDECDLFVVCSGVCCVQWPLPRALGYVLWMIVTCLLYAVGCAVCS
ncbi:hypothetical protein NDU88_000345, partial [Pleurodeles waltl]